MFIIRVIVTLQSSDSATYIHYAGLHWSKRNVNTAKDVELVKIGFARQGSLIHYI